MAGLILWYGTPAPPAEVLKHQLTHASLNLVIFLPAYQLLWDYLIWQGYTKVTMEFDLSCAVRDLSLWLLGFELFWYAQHRLMHDNKLKKNFPKKIFG